MAPDSARFRAAFGAFRLFKGQDQLHMPHAYGYKVDDHCTTSMANGTTDDFRYAAAQESLRLLKESRLSNALNSESSLCVPMDGDATGELYRIAVIPWLFMLPGLLLVLFGILYVILIMTPWVSASARTFEISGGSFALGIALLILSNVIGHGIFDRAVASRYGLAIRDFEERIAQIWRFAIEDPTTYRKQKVISEDYARGGLDRTGHGLLLAGMQYHYVLRPNDIMKIVEDNHHLLITFRVGAWPLTLAVSPLIADSEKEKRYRREIIEALKPARETEAV